MLNREEWIKAYGPAARIVTANTGIHPETLLAQAIIESSTEVQGGYYPAQSVLAKRANNFFGIKADPSWKGKKITLVTKEYRNGYPINVEADFRLYNDPSESFRDYINFLQVNPRYRKAGVFDAATPEIQAEKLAEAGYATDPSYATLLKGVILSVKKYLPPPTIALAILPLIITAGLFFLIVKKKTK